MDWWEFWSESKMLWIFCHDGILTVYVQICHQFVSLGGCDLDVNYFSGWCWGVLQAVVTAEGSSKDACEEAFSPRPLGFLAMARLLDLGRKLMDFMVGVKFPLNKICLRKKVSQAAVTCPLLQGPVDSESQLPG